MATIKSVEVKVEPRIITVEVGGGVPGTPGTDGTDGVSVTGATIDGSGHLILTLSVGGPIDAGVAKGTDGTDGVSITGASVDGSGHLILTRSVGGPIDAGLVVGADGTDGADGRSVTGASIDGSGHLVLTFSSAPSPVDLGDVTGEDGTDGTDGTDGVSVTGASVDGSYHLILTLSDSSTIDAGYVRGPAGAGSGDVIGPAGAVTGNFAGYTDTTGKEIEDSGYNAASFATAAQGIKADSAVQSITETGNGISINTSVPTAPVLSLDATLEAVANFATGANKVMVWSGTDTLTSFDVDTDGTLAANSDTRFPTQKAVKTYADQLIAAADVMVFKGVIDCSTNPNYPAADRGWTYRVSVAGKIGGASGVNVEAGDILLCLTDGTTSGTQAAVGANWSVIQANLDGALLTTSIGVAVQAWDADLDAIASLAKTDGNFIVGNGTTWVAESGATARTSLGLGTGDSPQFTAINVGHASDTTLTRVSAGVIAVEGSNVLLASGLGSITQAYSAVLAALATGVSLATGVFTITGTSSGPSEIRLREDTDNGTNHVGFKAPANLAADMVWELPAVDGTDGQVLQTNGSGVLTFEDAAGGDVAEIGDIRESYRDLSGDGFLAYDGSVYLKSAYPVLGALIGDSDAEWSDPVKVNNPASLPSNQSNDAAWSPNSRYLAIAHVSGSNLTIYDWDTGSPVKMSDPSTLPPSFSYGVGWSPDGRYLAVAHGTTPFVTIYDWNTGSPVKISNPATLPSSTGRSVCWSPDGRYMVIGHDSSPYMTIYDWNTGSPVKISNPSTLPTNACVGADWSLSGRYLAVAHASTPYVTIYDWNTGSPVKISNPGTLPTGAGEDVGWSPDNRYLAVSHGTSPYVTIYDWNTGGPVKISNPATLPVGTGTGVVWSPDGRYMAVAHGSSPFVTIYDWESGVPVKIADPASLPAGQSYGIDWSADLRYLTVAHNTSPYVTTYDGFAALGYNPSTEFKLATAANKWVRADD